MSHTKDIAQGHKAHGVEHGGLGKTIAHLPPGEGNRSLWVMGERVTLKVPSQQTGGAYSLFESTTQPADGPPIHVHHREDESFYVLEGEYEFLVDGRTLKAEAGFLIYVPKGTLHAHVNVGDGVGRMLMSQTPGGLYELFFKKVGRTADDHDGGPLTLANLPHVEKRIVEVAAEHGTEIPPPLVDETWRLPAGQGHASSPSARNP